MGAGDRFNIVTYNGRSGFTSEIPLALITSVRQFIDTARVLAITGSL